MRSSIWDKYLESCNPGSRSQISLKIEGPAEVQMSRMCSLASQSLVVRRILQNKTIKPASQTSLLSCSECCSERGKQIVKMQKMQQILLIAGTPVVSHSKCECTLCLWAMKLFLVSTWREIFHQYLDKFGELPRTATIKWVFLLMPFVRRTVQRFYDN